MQPGRSEEGALQRAAATSGQAVLISGGTVLIAMAGMLLSGSKIFTSIGVGAMLVVFAAMVGSLTVLPALLGKLGDRVDLGFLAVVAAGLLKVTRWMSREPRVARAPAQPEDVPAPAEGRPPGVPRLGDDPRAGAPLPGCLRRAGGDAPRRARAAGCGRSTRSC